MALALDSSTPAQVSKGGTGTTLVTASFTAPANALLVAFIGSNGSGASQPTYTMSNTGDALTWTKIGKLDNQGSANTPSVTGRDGNVWVFVATATSSATRTVTATQSQAQAGLMYLAVFTDSGGGQPTAGAVNGASGSSGGASCSVTTTTDGSWVWAVASDWNASGDGAAGTNQTNHAYYDDNVITAYVWAQDNTTATSGTSVTNDLSVIASEIWNELVVEIEPGPTGPTEKSSADTAHGEDDLPDQELIRQKRSGDRAVADDNTYFLDSQPDQSPQDTNLYPSAYGNQSGSTWAGQANMYADDGTVCTWTNAVNGGVGYVEVNTFDYSSIPADATINSVTVNWNIWVSNTTRISGATGGLYKSGTLQGSTKTLTRPTADGTTQTQQYTGLTRADLANLSVRTTFTHNASTTSAIGRIDVMYLTVNWSPAASGSTREVTSAGDASKAAEDVTALSTDGAEGKSGPETGGAAEATILSVTVSAADTRPAATDAATMAAAMAGSDTRPAATDAATLAATTAGSDTRPAATEAVTGLTRPTPETAGGAEAASLAATSSTPDTRPAATEAASLAATLPTQADTGQSAEQSSLLASGSSAQTAGSTEGQTLTAAMAGADSRPAAGEAVTLTVVLATGDTATAVEGQSKADLGNDQQSGDSRPAATEGQSLVAQVTPQESALGATETASVGAQVGSTQPTSASEQASLLASVPGQLESAGQSEGATLVVSVTAADIGACAEAVSLLAALSGSDTAAADSSQSTTKGGALEDVESASTLESGTVARTSATGETRPVADSASLLATPPGQSQAGVSFDSAVLAVQITQVQFCSATEAATLESSMVADEPVEYAEQAVLVAVISASDLLAAAEATSLIHGGVRNWHGISATSDAAGVMTVNVQLSGGREATIRIKRLEG